MGTLYFDIDGVLLDWNTAFADFWNAKHPEESIGNNPLTWGGNPEHREAIYEFCATPIFLPLLDSKIPEIMHQLHRQYRIEILTGGSNYEHRTANLQRYNIPFDQLTCDTHNKIDRIVNPVAIFEDCPRHLDLMSETYPDRVWAPYQWHYVRPYASHPGIKLYGSPTEWLSLLQ